MTAVDLEVTIPDGKDLLTEMAESNIAAAVRLIQAGANPATVIRTLYLLGYFDGLVRV